MAFRLPEALGTQEDVVSRLQGLRPTRSRTYASATALPRSPQGSLPAWVGWPLTGRGSHPLDDTQGFMTYSSIPLDRPAWPHHATTPCPGGSCSRPTGTCSPPPTSSRVQGLGILRLPQRSRLRDCDGAGCDNAECDDRHGPPSFLRRRSMKHRWLGRTNATGRADAAEHGC